jgi:hypothetical protein
LPLEIVVVPATHEDQDYTLTRQILIMDGWSIRTVHYLISITYIKRRSKQERNEGRSDHSPRRDLFYCKEGIPSSVSSKICYLDPHVLLKKERDSFY